MLFRSLRKVRREVQAKHVVLAAESHRSALPARQRNDQARGLFLIPLLSSRLKRGGQRRGWDGVPGAVTHRSSVQRSVARRVEPDGPRRKTDVDGQDPGLHRGRRSRELLGLVGVLGLAANHCHHGRHCRHARDGERQRRQEPRSSTPAPVAAMSAPLRASPYLVRKGLVRRDVPCSPASVTITMEPIVLAANASETATSVSGLS